MTEFKTQGISIIGISYDSVHVLKSFADKHQISYPLLSDVSSEVIKKFGIFNTAIDSNSQIFGIPHPGIYIIDKNLKVVKKQFEKSYADRPSAENVLAMHFDKPMSSHVKAFKTSYLTGSIAVTDTIASRAQMLGLIVNFSLSQGFHLYGKPIPEGYIPLTIKLESNPNFAIDSFQFPETKKFTLDSINETFNILPKEMTVKSSLRINKRPEHGSYSLNITLKFQACDDKVCMPPEELKFQFPLTIVKTNI